MNEFRTPMGHDLQKQLVNLLQRLEIESYDIVEDIALVPSEDGHFWRNEATGRLSLTVVGRRTQEGEQE